MFNWWLLIILMVVSYFIGNINFARILSSRKKVDITKLDSGNPGATNMYRNLGAKAGYATLVLDAAKGFVCALKGFLVFGGYELYPQVMLGTYISCDATIALYACGFCAMLGHNFPIIYNFKGGKGVSTMLGVFLVSQPIALIVVFILAFVFVWFYKYLSFASMMIVTILVLWQNLMLNEPNLAISLITFGIFAMTLFAHRSNIKRLLLGKETPTNIKSKILKEQKRKQRMEEKSEEKAEKQELKTEIKEAKQEFK
ncbi:MAG: glycerol-3-phosphate acyltransferase, partial [Clostridia bacterium]|nr:glycerol-3-phosphate acyltransferase [Clostridia bacterium]